MARNHCHEDHSNLSTGPRATQEEQAAYFVVSTVVLCRAVLSIRTLPFSSYLFPKTAGSICSTVKIETENDKSYSRCQVPAFVQLYLGCVELLVLLVLISLRIAYDSGCTACLSIAHCLSPRLCMCMGRLLRRSLYIWVTKCTCIYAACSRKCMLSCVCISRASNHCLV